MKYDYKRSVKLKGPNGEVEMLCHDSKTDTYGSIPMTTKELLDEAINGYRALAAQPNEKD